MKFPLVKKTELSPIVKILTDYPRDDLASDEVHQALVSACVHHGVRPYNLDVGAIPGMNTVVAGFKTAQLALNSTLGFGHIIHTNCAPRRNIVTNNSKGEGVVLGILPNGVTLLTVSSGYSLAPFYDLIQSGDAQFFETRIPDSGSQFRSRDYFPDGAARLARYYQDVIADKGQEYVSGCLKQGRFADIIEGFEFVGDRIDENHFNDLPTGSIYYIDNFGNMKLNIAHDDLTKQYKPGETLILSVNDQITEAVVGKAGFSLGEGILALTRGSSGWHIKGEDMRLTEVFLRGGNAAQSFKDINPGDQITILSKQDLAAVIDQIRESGLKKLRTLDLYIFSESQLVKLLAIEGLIEAGFKTDKLRQAISDNSLIDKLK